MLTAGCRFCLGTGFVGSPAPSGLVVCPLCEGDRRPGVERMFLAHEALKEKLKEALWEIQQLKLQLALLQEEKT